jgi:hypothetical protein
MGTSTSSAGAGAGSPFDPPWLDSAGDGIDQSNSDAQLQPSDAGDSTTEPAKDSTNDSSSLYSEQGEVTSPGTAPPGRYKDARRLMGRFIRSGDRNDIGRAVGSMVNKGMGGPSRAAGRMKTSAIAAAALGGFLAAAREGTNPNIAEWVESARARGLTARDAALEVIQQLAPDGGSVDEESAKHSMNQAIIHLYDVDPTADILAMSDEQIASVMGYTLAFDVFNRIQLELGRVFEKLKYSAQVVHHRLGEVQDYLLVVVGDAMKVARSGGRMRSVQDIAKHALRNTLDVFGAQ